MLTKPKLNYTYC